MTYECNSRHCPNEKYIILKNCNYIPYDIPSLVEVFEYFQYIAPGVSSIHSWTLPQNKHQEVYNKLFVERDFKATIFSSSQNILKRRFEENHLSDKRFCYKCKRFVCKKDSNESELSCLLRHLRNSLAHGLIYLPLKNNPFVCFMDLDKNKSISAIIVCKRKDLEDWKKIIESYR